MIPFSPPDAVGGIAARHQAALSQGQFLIQRCGGCQQHGDRQIAGAKTALAHGNGGTLSSRSTAILGLAETL